MGNLTHTVSGDIASFRSAARVPIESLKCHFLPIQEGSGDSSSSNVRNISGWNQVNIFHTGKNVMHVTAYSAGGYWNSSPDPYYTNIYGTSINTLNGSGPVSVTQSTYDETLTKSDYRNGYFAVRTDTLQFDKVYRISIKVTNIINNPLNASLSDMKIYGADSGQSATVALVDGSRVVFNLLRHKQHSTATLRNEIYIYICAMDCTISEIMATEANETNYIYAPYCGSTIPITFPVLGKNKLDITSYSTLHNTTLNNNYLISTATDTRTDFQISVIGYNGTTLLKQIFGQGYVTTGIFSKTFTLSDDLKNMDIIWIKHNGISRDIGIKIPVNLIIGQTYTFSMDIIGNDPTTIGGLQFGNIQIELGSTATTYEPYSSANTIYGGYIDTTKGEIVAEYAQYQFIGTETLSKWNLYTATNPTLNIAARINKTIIMGQYQDGAKNVLCNCLPSVSNIEMWYGRNNVDHGVCVSNDNYVTLQVPGIETLEDMSIWLTNNHPIICYKLYTPIHYPLSKTELKTFLDQNNIWSNTNDITEVSYQIHDSNMIQQVKKNILAENNYHYRKVLWNNITNGYMSDNDWKSYNTNVVSATFNDGIASCEVLDTSKIRYTASLVMKTYPPITQNNKYYASYIINPEYQGSFGIEYAAGQQLAGTEMQCPANTWTRRSFVQYGRANANGAMYIPFPSGYPEGITPRFQVKSPIYINLTAMFGPGNEPTKAEFERLCEINNIDLTQAYSKDAGTEQLWCIPGHDLNSYSTVTWNQQAMPISSSYYKAYNSEHIAVTFEDDILTSTWLTDGTEYSWSVCANYSKTHAVGNYYYLQYEYYTDIDGYIGGDVGGVTTPYVKTQLNQWVKYTTIVQRTTGGNLSNYVVYVNRFSKNGNIPTTGSICKARNIMAIDLTSMFGAGNEPTTTADLYARCSKNNINLNEFQPYKTGEKMIWIV